MIIDTQTHISIVVPCHNAAPYVQLLLEGLDNSEARDLETVFVNDASTDPAIKPLLLEYCKMHARCQYLENPVQQLFTRTVNRGIRACSPFTEVFVLLNTDCELQPGWLQRMIDTHNAYDNVACVGFPDGTLTEGLDIEVFNPAREGHPDYVTGHCMLIPKWAFQQYGVFCETDLNAAHIHSEHWWCITVLSQGHRMFYIQSPQVRHDVCGPSWGRSLDWLYNFNLGQLWPGKDSL